MCIADPDLSVEGPRAAMSEKRKFGKLTQARIFLIIGSRSLIDRF